MSCARDTIIFPVLNNCFKSLNLKSLFLLFSSFKYFFLTIRFPTRKELGMSDLKQEAQYSNEKTLKPSKEALTVTICYLEWLEKSMYFKSDTWNILCLKAMCPTKGLGFARVTFHMFWQVSVKDQFQVHYHLFISKIFYPRVSYRNPLIFINRITQFGLLFPFVQGMPGAEGRVGDPGPDGDTVREINR